MITVEEFEKYLDTHVKENMQRDIIRRIIAGYRHSNSVTKYGDFAPQPAKNAFPGNRGAAIDTFLLGLTGKYEGFEVISKPNTKHNHYYTLIRSPYIVMTVSHVSHPKAVPREAKFRNEYATIQTRFVDQGGRFEIVPPEMCGRILYVIILHGTFDKANPYIPGFIYFGFPSHDCKSYITKIDLCNKYKDTVQEMLQLGTEYIKDMAQPGLIVERSKQEPLL